LPGRFPGGISFTPDGTRLVAQLDTSIGIWDAATGQRVCLWPRLGVGPAVETELVISRDGDRILLIGRRTGKVFAVDLQTGVTTGLPELGVAAEGTTFQGVTPDFKTLIQCVPTSGDTRALRIHNLSTGADRLIPLPDPVGDLRVSADGCRAVGTLGAGLSHQPRLFIVDLSEARIRHLFTLNAFPIRPDVSPDGRRFAFTGWDGLEAFQAQLWDADSGKTIMTTVAGAVVGFNADGRLVVRDDTGYRLYDAAGTVVANWPANKEDVPRIHHMAAGGRFFAAPNMSEYPAALRWLLERLPGRPIDPDGEQVNWTVLDARSGRKHGTVPGDDVSEINLAPDGTTLVVELSEGLRAWDMPPRKPAGFILALMIAEVSLAIAWTALRRRRRRTRCAAS
jgi:hypothetical protein